MYHHPAPTSHESIAPPEIFPDNDSEYIQTEDAQLLLRALYAADLPLSHEALEELDRESDKRYGNAYAWLTRALAGWIGGSEQRLFPAREESWSDELMDFVPPEPFDTSRLHPTGSSGADLVIDLIKQQVEALASGDTSSDIPAAPRASSLKQSSCKDVEVYFAQTVDGYFDARIETVALGDKHFWHKSHGAPTYLNLEPIKYKGVELPPGCVFRKDEDGEGLMFLRVTGLAFRQDEAVELFGSALSSYYETPHGERELNNLFATFARARDQLADAA